MMASLWWPSLLGGEKFQLLPKIHELDFFSHLPNNNQKTLKPGFFLVFLFYFVGQNIHWRIRRQFSVIQMKKVLHIFPRLSRMAGSSNPTNMLRSVLILIYF